jgi:hypothetical protein
MRRHGIPEMAGRPEDLGLVSLISHMGRSASAAR